MWGHQAWKGSFFPAKTPAKQFLNYYSRYYTAVEGNTTFYALPSQDTVKTWIASVPADFRFCFKVPQLVSHKLGLEQGRAEFESFLEVMAPIIESEQLGKLWLQLPPYFSFKQFTLLEAWLNDYSRDLPFAVEVRHPDFYAKGEAERCLNRLLMDHKVDRVMMDTRPVHSEVAVPGADNHEAIQDAQSKKPKLPVHLLSTGNNPTVRYVGTMDLENNRPFIQNWLKPMKAWLDEGKQPYLFVHTADNASIHDLVELWLDMLTEYLGYRPYQDKAWPNQGDQGLVDNQPSLF
ncbi:hypothetical protein C2869_19475 [Saccharobesus litoralis]|uniref:DUF72 domain-containing protein n=2 Tax=Saccharobesus litoralis TaxID=2172099 RepID=A0A2S0VY30_9ALTE|nr:hypothetical protein C2869_19475 [Saccharobesus litoralis]